MSSEEKEPYEEEVVDHGNWHNYGYWVKVDISLLYGMSGGVLRLAYRRRRIFQRYGHPQEQES